MATQMHRVPSELLPMRATKFVKACSGHWSDVMISFIRSTRSSIASSGRLASSMKLVPSVPIAVLALKVLRMSLVLSLVMSSVSSSPRLLGGVEHFV